MSEDNDREKKGFSGISNFVSDISGADEVAISEPSSPPLKPSQATASNETECKISGYPQQGETVGNSKSGGDSCGKWILGIIPVIYFVIWLVSDGRQSTKKASHNPPPQAQTYNFQESRPSPTTTPKTSQSSELQYEKPPVGTNKVFSASQIRWCVREGIRIETMRDFIATNKAVDGFNRIVDDYNRRCGSYSYRRGTLKQAKREVESLRSEIVAEAIKEGRKLGYTY